MKQALTLIAVLACSLYANSQEFYIKGKVIDQDNQPVAFANVLLLNAADSTFVNGTSADDEGLFTLEAIVPNLYLLQASYVGRGSTPLAIDVKDNVSLGALIIPSATENLDEVVVTATKPKVERLNDRLVFTVENTVVSQGTSWDILRNTPGVIINQDALTIRGNEATVYLNGRRVQLSSDEVKDLLEGFSGQNVKSIEVIPNPPANFDAEGGPVLNIITNKGLTPGYKGNVNGTYTQAVFPKYTLGTSHYFKTEKLNLFANYSFNPKKELRKTAKGINFINDSDEIFSSWDTNIEEIKRSKAHNATAIIDYYFDDNNSINVTANYVNNPNQTWNSNLQTTILNNQNILDSTFTTANAINADNVNFATDLTYTHRFKNPGTKLDINGHFTDFNQQFFQTIASNYFDASGQFLRDFSFDTNSNQDINIYTGQLDFTTPVGQGSFDTGVKASVIDSQSQIEYVNFQGSDESVNAGLSDNFLYDETVYAGYVSMVQGWDKWSIKAGLRGEYTDAKGTSLSLGTVNNQEFFELFPSIYILHSPSDKHSFALDYSRGLDRPKYNDLNPFRNFFNENDFEEGNAGLQASFTNNFNFNYTFNSELFFDVYYRDNGRLIDDLVFQDNQNLTLRELKQNVLGSTSYGLDITLSKSILDPWYVYAYVSLFHEDLDITAVESNNATFTNEVDGVYAYWANYLTLSNDGTFSGEVTFTYLSDFIFGTYLQDEQLNLSVGLRKSLWNNRAVVSITAEDILEQYVPTYTSKYLNQDNFYRRRPETQFVRLGFTYNFGNFRLEDNEREISKKERERLESKD